MKKHQQRHNDRAKEPQIFDIKQNFAGNGDAIGGGRGAIGLSVSGDKPNMNYNPMTSRSQYHNGLFRERNYTAYSVSYSIFGVKLLPKTSGSISLYNQTWVGFTYNNSIFNR